MTIIMISKNDHISKKNILTTCSGSIGASRPAASSKSFISLATSLVAIVVMMSIMLMILMMIMIIIVLLLMIIMMPT